MNILFLYQEAINPLTGGAERITFLLGKYLESKGYKIYFLGLNNKNLVSDERQFFLPNSKSILSKENIDFFQSFLFEKSINVLINKGATNPEISALSFYSKNNGVKLISVIHNSVLGGIKNFSSAQKARFKKMGIELFLPLTDIKLINYIILNLYKYKYQKHYRRLCSISDFVVLESEKFKVELSFLLGKHKAPANVIGIPNFIIQDTKESKTKEKEILYVGRINTSQKRVDLLLTIWSYLHSEFSDWKLKIVGGGDELESIIELSHQMGLKNIFFYGYSDAKKFYETASIICLTSSYEGFGLTLIEAMQYGVVPFSFNSYLSVTDIIDNNINGMIIKPFDTNEYADKLAWLMSNGNELNKFSIAAKKKSKLFDLSIVGIDWLKLLQI
jgi:glycosyltransferase involved in cell wall biosynthesis